MLASPLRAEIATAAARGYRFYVYMLADTNGVFYVGKGTGGRLAVHQSTDRNGAKALRISQAGGNLQRTVVAYFNDEAAAYLHESELIAQLRNELTNISGGSVTPLESAIASLRASLARLKPYGEWISAASEWQLAKAAMLAGSPLRFHRQTRASILRHIWYLKAGVITPDGWLRASVPVELLRIRGRRRA